MFRKTNAIALNTTKMKDSTFNFQKLVTESVGRFLLSAFSLPMLLTLAKVSKDLNKKIQSDCSPALSEKFEVPNYALIRDSYLLLPKVLRQLIVQNELSFNAAINLRMPAIIRHQLENNEIVFKQALLLLNKLACIPSMVDMVDSNCNPSVFEGTFNDGVMCPGLNLIFENEWTAFNKDQFAKIINIMFKLTGTENEDDPLMVTLKDFFTSMYYQPEQILPKELSPILLTLAGRHASEMGVAATKKPVSAENLLDILVKILNANLSSNRQIVTYAPAIVEVDKQIFMRILNRNTVYALERNLINFDQLILRANAKSGYLALVLSDIGIDILEKMGSYDALLAAAPNQKTLLELMYSQKINSTEGDLLSTDYMCLYHLTSFRTRECLDAGYFSLDDLFTYGSYFDLFHLLVSDSGIQCFKNGTLTFKEAVEMRRATSKLAALILANREIQPTIQEDHLPLNKALLTEAIAQLRNIIHSSNGYNMKMQHGIFSGQPSRPFREMLTIVTQLESYAKPVKIVFQELIQCANNMNNLKLAAAFSEYEQEIKLQNREQTLKERSGVILKKCRP